MERNSLSKSLKDHCVGNNRGSRDSNNIPHKHLPFQNMLKGPNWNLNNQRSTIGGDDPDLRVGGGLVSWPPRSYPCGFCKREFRSAQALGGHMNVHRRDRARLRQSSPPGPADDYPILSLNPNPSHNTCPAPSNPKFGPPKSPSSFLSPPPSKDPKHPCPSPSPTSVTDIKLASFKFCRSSSLRDMSNSTEAFHTQSTTGHSVRGDGSMCLRSGPLNLEIGLFGKLKADEVDLELRLGYS